MTRQVLRIGKQARITLPLMSATLVFVLGAVEQRAMGQVPSSPEPRIQEAFDGLRTVGNTQKALDAAKELSKQRPVSSKTVSVLVDALDHVDEEVAIGVTRLLGAMPDEVIGPLVHASVHAGTTRKRVNALGALIWQGKNARVAVPQLIKLRTDKDPHIRLTVIAALFATEDSAGIAALRDRLLNDRDFAVRAQAAVLLPGYGQRAKNAIPDLIQTVEEMIRLRAPGLPHAIEFTGSGYAGEPITDLLICSIRGLEEFGKLAVDFLAARLENSEADMCWYMLNILKCIGADASVAAPDIARLFPSPHARIRAEVASLFRKFPSIDKQTVQQLHRAMKDPASSVRLEAAATLCHHEPKNDLALTVLLEEAGSPEVVIRRDAIHYLGDHSQWTDRHLAALRKATKDPNSNVRWAALVELSEKASVVPLVQSILLDSFDDTDEVNRAEAIYGLRNCKYSVLGMQKLVAASRDPSPTVRAAVVSAVADFGAGKPPTLEILRQFLKDPDESVRSTARDLLDRR